MAADELLGLVGEQLALLQVFLRCRAESGLVVLRAEDFLYERAVGVVNRIIAGHLHAVVFGNAHLAEAVGQAGEHGFHVVVVIFHGAAFLLCCLQRGVVAAAPARAFVVELFGQHVVAHALLVGDGLGRQIVVGCGAERLGIGVVVEIGIHRHQATGGERGLLGVHCDGQL